MTAHLPKTRTQYLGKVIKSAQLREPKYGSKEVQRMLGITAAQMKYQLKLGRFPKPELVTGQCARKYFWSKSQVKAMRDYMNKDSAT